MGVRNLLILNWLSEIEDLATNQGVVGSNPAGRATFRFGFTSLTERPCLASRAPNARAISVSNMRKTSEPQIILSITALALAQSKLQNFERTTLAPKPLNPRMESPITRVRHTRRRQSQATPGHTAQSDR